IRVRRTTVRLFCLIDTVSGTVTHIINDSHRLVEEMRLADRVEVLRDGCNAGSLSRQQISHDAMVRAMVGRDPQAMFAHTADTSGEVRLTVQEVRVPGTSTDVSLQVRGREIVVVAGLIGAGRSELLETIFGLREAEAGQIVVDGKPLRSGKVREANAAGLALVSED